MKFNKKVIFAFIVTLFSAGAGFADNAKVMIKEVHGTVTVERGGSALPAEKGMPLEAQDVIQTSSDGQADIVWNEKWGYRLLGSSACVLVNTEKQAAKVEMTAGDIVALVKALPENATFEVGMPTSVAAVRGTQFWGRVHPDGNGASTFAVREGTVQIKVLETGEEFLVNAGEALDIQKGKKLHEIRSALEAELAAIAQAEQIDLSPAP